MDGLPRWQYLWRGDITVSSAAFPLSSRKNQESSPEFAILLERGWLHAEDPSPRLHHWPCRFGHAIIGRAFSRVA